MQANVSVVNCALVIMTGVGDKGRGDRNLNQTHSKGPL